MVKLQGPMFSLAASGTLAKTLTYSHWKGRAFARRRIIPGNPQSAGQVSLRSMFAFLGSEWGALATVDQDTWAAPAARTIISPFNAFCASGLDRNRSFLAPSQTYPPTPTSAPQDVSVFIAFGGVRQTSIFMNVGGAGATAWGILLFQSTSSGFTPAFSNLVAVVPAAGPAAVVVTNRPLTPDTYYYDAKSFSADGFIGSLKGEISAVAT